MIPLRLAELKDKIDKNISPILSLEENLIKCSVCSNKLKKDNAFVALFKNNDSFNVVCDKCVRVASMSNSIAFYDSYEIFMKRKKSGWIDQFFKEYLADKEKRKNATNKKSS